MLTSVVVEGLDGVVVDSDEVRILGTTREQLIETTRREVEQGASRIELCGGFGAGPHAEVTRALGGQVRVGAVMYGFDSLESVTEYKRRFGAGVQLLDAFIYLRTEADPVADRTDRGVTAFVPVPDEQSTGPVAAALAAEGRTLIELYAGLGPVAEASALNAIGRPIALGLALYPDHPTTT